MSHKGSFVKEERKGFSEAMSFLREGDTFVVWRLDRLGRSLKHLIDVVTSLEKSGKNHQSPVVSTSDSILLHSGEPCTPSWTSA